MAVTTKYQFDPVDHRFMRLRGHSRPANACRRCWRRAAIAWVVSAMRSRLARRYPDLSPEEINLKMLEEIDRAERRHARPQPLS